MRILIAVPEQDRISGNWVSAYRFRQGLEKLGHEISLFSMTKKAEQPLRNLIQEFRPEVALLLHAYRSGKPWLEHAQEFRIPFVTMLTGTDINLGLSDPFQNTAIMATISQAEFVLIQNPLLAKRFLQQHPELEKKLRVIKPGIALGTESYDLHGTHGLDNSSPLFLCPAGIRPVKMQTELLDILDKVSPEGSLQLAFCGPCLNENYYRTFLQEIDNRPWAKYLGTIAPAAMAEVMRQSDIIINNSHAEGLSNTLVEAATLGIPILARNNPGNAAVVKHNTNGLLYRNTVECLGGVRFLLKKENRATLSLPDNSYDVNTEATDLEHALTEAIQLHSLQH